MTFFCQNLSSNDGMSGPGTDDLGSLFIRATKGQDKSAMEEFLAIILPRLTKYVRAWCSKRHLSWDFPVAVACGSLMKALAKAETLDLEKCGGNVMVWLRAITHNEFIECIRFMERGDCESLDDKLMRPTHGKNAREEDKRDALRLVAGPDPLEELIQRDDDARRKRLEAAIRRLPELKRQVVELYRAGNSVGVIAVMLTLPPPRVSKILSDAKAELRRRIG